MNSHRDKDEAASIAVASTDPRQMSSATGFIDLDIPITGMTCTSCSARIEKKLNKIPEVDASVNYALGNAHVRHSTAVSTEKIIDTITGLGYHAQLPATHQQRADAKPVNSAAAPAETAEGKTADAATTETASDNRHTEHGKSSHHSMAAMSPQAHYRQLRRQQRRLIISVMLGFPVILISMVSAWQPTYWPLITLALTTPVVWYGGWPFHQAAVVNARHGTTTMDTLVSLGISVSYLWSVYATFHLAYQGFPTMDMSATSTTDHNTWHLYYETACAITMFLLIGKYLEARAKYRSSEAIRSLLSMGVREVTILDPQLGGQERTIQIEDLTVGMQFIARPGEQIATDGVIVRGAAAIDQSLLTGESVPVEVSVGDQVTGATINTSGHLVIRATSVGADTRLGQLTRLVAAAQTGKATVQRLADRISSVFVPIVLVIAASTFLGWMLAGHTATALSAAVAVLVVACPCALGLATPTALLVGTGRASQLGILIKGPLALENSKHVDTVVLDKTGTLTTGTMSVANIVAVEQYSSNEVLQYAAAVEIYSEHPIARAIVAAAQPHPSTALPPTEETEISVASLELPPATDFQMHAGSGVQARVAGHCVNVGRPEWITHLPQQESTSLPANLVQALQDAAHIGGSSVVVTIDDQLAGVITVTDTAKSDAAAAIGHLQQLGLHTAILTGDQSSAAQSVASAVGIDAGDVFAQTQPEDKILVVQRLQREGRTVAMVGDGVNDAAALAQADLAIAMGSGTDIAMDVSDITIIRTHLMAVVDAVRLARRTLRTIKGNLVWAFGYNIAMIPLAAMGLLNPMIAAAAMALSSVFVVTNSLRLRRFQPTATDAGPQR